MTNEYVIINKTAIQKRIEECDKEISILCRVGHNQLGKDLEITNIAIAKLYSEKRTLNLFLSQSTPLIDEIEKAFDEGFNSEEEVYKGNPTGKIIGKKEYLSNLKLNI